VGVGGLGLGGVCCVFVVCGVGVGWEGGWELLECGLFVIYVLFCRVFVF
jgi:hypothetical protein